MNYMVVRQSSFMVMKMAESTFPWMVLVQLVAIPWIRTAMNMAVYLSTFIRASIVIVVWSNLKLQLSIHLRFKKEYSIGMMARAAIATSQVITVALPLHIKSSLRVLMPNHDTWLIYASMQRIRSVQAITESLFPSASPKTTLRKTLNPKIMTFLRNTPSNWAIWLISPNLMIWKGSTKKYRQARVWNKGTLQDSTRRKRRLS